MNAIPLFDSEKHTTNSFLFSSFFYRDRTSAQSIEHLTTEQEVTGSISGTRVTRRVSKRLRNEGITFAPKTARL